MRLKTSKIKLTDIFGQNRNQSPIMRLFTFCLTFFFFFSVTAQAQAQTQQSKQSIYKIDPWADGLIIGITSLGVFGAYTDSASLIRPRCPCNLNEINSLDRSVVGNHDRNMEKFSDAAAVAAVAVPVYLDWHELGFSPEFKEDAVVFLETLTVNASLVTFAKYNVQRPLPRTYDGDPALINSAKGYRSFYSGHTSTVFAALSMTSYTYNKRHNEATWPWVFTGVFGASVAYARVAAGRHFYTDVLVGAGMGTAVGILVPWMHSKERLNHLSLLPMESGLGLAWRNSF